MRVGVTLACSECKRRNYTTNKNKKNNPDRIELNKYCPFCKKHRLVHGDSTHPLDEDRLKAIHDLLLKGERA